MLEAGDVPASAGTGSGTEVAASSSAGTDYAAQEWLGPNGELKVGKEDASLVLTVFTNHACDYCRQFATEQLGKLLAGFVRRGDLQVQIIPVQLAKYPDSRLSAVALHCSVRLGKGLAMHNSLLALPTRTEKTIIQAATDIGIDPVPFKSCMTDPTSGAVEHVDATLRIVSEQNITLVPTFFLGGERITGLPEYPDLRGKIELLLKQQ